MLVSDPKTESNPNKSLVELSKFYAVDVISQPRLLIPTVTLEEYTESICPNGYNKDGFSSSSPQVLIGQGINNNGGLQLAQVIGNKLPSYEDILSGNSNITHHKKTMLDGLLLSTGLDTPTTSFKTIHEMSSKLLLLPTKKTLKEDPLWSINGLPYYDERDSMYKISQLKKSNKLKDIEVLHGAVISNQFLNNRRKLRNYQWKQFYADRSGNSERNNLQLNLRSNIKEGSVLIDEETLIEEERQNQENLKLKLSNLNDPLGGLDLGKTEAEKEEELKLREDAKQKRIAHRLEEQERRKNIKNRTRFIYNNQEYINDIAKDTVLIEEEVMTQNLNYIPGFHNDQPQEVRKLVRKRRRPNANSLGHSNIRGVKPTYYK